MSDEVHAELLKRAHGLSRMLTLGVIAVALLSSIGLMYLAVGGFSVATPRSDQEL